MDDAKRTGLFIVIIIIVITGQQHTHTHWRRRKTVGNGSVLSRNGLLCGWVLALAFGFCPPVLQPRVDVFMCINCWEKLLAPVGR